MSQNRCGMINFNITYIVSIKLALEVLEKEKAKSFGTVWK